MSDHIGIPLRVSKSVQKMYAGNEVAQELFDTWANQNNRSETTVEKMLSDTNQKHDRVEIVEFLKELSKAGCGRFIRGRRGASSRIVWNYNRTVLSKTATGIDLVEQTDKDVDDDDIDANFTQAVFEARELIADALNVSSDLVHISVRLMPTD